MLDTWEGGCGGRLGSSCWTIEREAGIVDFLVHLHVVHLGGGWDSGSCWTLGGGGWENGSSCWALGAFMLETLGGRLGWWALMFRHLGGRLG